METKRNPIVYSDYPDPDIICVDNTYFPSLTAEGFPKLFRHRACVRSTGMSR